MFNSSDTCKKKKKKQLESSFQKSNISQPQMDGWMFSDHQKKKIKNHQTEDLQHYRNTLIKAKIKKVLTFTSQPQRRPLPSSTRAIPAAACLDVSDDAHVLDSLTGPKRCPQDVCVCQAGVGAAADNWHATSTCWLTVFSS